MSEKKYDPYTGNEIVDEAVEVVEEAAATDDATMTEEITQDVVVETAPKAAAQEVKAKEAASGKAIASMVLGIVSVMLMVSCCCAPLAIITGIAGIVCFILAPKPHGSKENMSIAGIICSSIAVVGSIIITVIFILLVIFSDDVDTDSYTEYRYRTTTEHYEDVF